MSPSRTVLAVAAAVAAASLVAAPAAGAKTQKQAKADLAMQRVTLSPKFVVIKPNGKPTAQVSVTVSIRNIGGAPAPPTDTSFKLMQGSHVLARDHVPLPRLAPGHTATQIAIFHDAEPQLGLMDAHASADSNLELAGSVTNDSKSTPDIPVIAQRWTGSMGSEVKTPGLFGASEDDDATSDVTWTFSRLDGLHRFVYTVGGTVKQTTTFSGNGCTGQNSTSLTMPRWGRDSGLYLSQDLTQYESIIRGSLVPSFLVNITCPGSSAPTPNTVPVRDFLTETTTGSLRQPMHPSARRLGDIGTLGILITVTNQWLLAADVP